MTLIDLLVFVVLGSGVGFLAGLFGVGGGFIITPILILSYELSGLSPAVLTHVAIGTSLFVVVFASATSAYQHGKHGNVDWRSVRVLGLSSAMMALGMTWFAAALSGRYLRMIFAIVLMAAAIRMLMERAEQARERLEVSSQPSPLALAGLGLSTGAVSALAGIGGGVFLMPMMYHLLRMPLRLVIGTCSATIVITASVSLAGYIVNGIGRPGLPEWSLGFVDLQRGVSLALGTVLAVRAGARVSLRTHPYRLRKLFALFILLLSIYFLVR